MDTYTWYMVGGVVTLVGIALLAMAGWMVAAANLRRERKRSHRLATELAVQRRRMDNVAGHLHELRELVAAENSRQRAAAAPLLGEGYRPPRPRTPDTIRFGHPDRTA